MKSLESKLFLLIAFFIGTWGALFESVLPVLLGIGFLYNIVKFSAKCRNALWQYRYYLAIPVLLIIYVAIHSLFIINSGKYADIKPNFGVFEKLSLCFLLVILYVVSAKCFMTLKLLKQFLLCFCISVFTFNFVMLFHVTGTTLFTEPMSALTYLYESRFGFTKYFLGGRVYLDAQALQVYAAALISYFFGISSHRRWDKVIAFIAFIVLVWFLSLTVTKSSILAFLCGFILFNFYFLRKLTVRFRWTLVIACVFLVVVGYIFRPANFERRWDEIKHEIEEVRQGKLSGGSSIVPRIVFYQSCLKHIDSWGVWGLGVYTERVSKQWYLDSGNHVVAVASHSHNSFLQYWMWMGIVGLLFILSWFCLPLIRMFRSKKYSFLAMSIIVALFVDCNFEVQLIINDALPAVIFLLAMFYVCHERFYELEDFSRKPF